MIRLGFNTQSLSLGASLVMLVVKSRTVNVGDKKEASWVPGLGGSPGGGCNSLLQHSCLENPMHRGAWQATVRRVAESDTTERLSTQHIVSKATAKKYIGLQTCISNSSVSMSTFLRHLKLTEEMCFSKFLNSLTAHSHLSVNFGFYSKFLPQPQAPNPNNSNKILPATYECSPFTALHM